MLSSGLVVVHDTSRGGEDDETERSGGEEQVDLETEKSGKRDSQSGCGMWRID